MLTFDGIYTADDDDQPQFQVLPAPDDDEIARLTASLAQRMTKLLARRRLGPDNDPEESDSLRRDEPWRWLGSPQRRYPAEPHMVPMPVGVGLD